MHNYLGFLCAFNLVHLCQEVIIVCWCASGSQHVYMIDLPSSTFYITYWWGWRGRCLHRSSLAVWHSCSPLHPPPWPGGAPGWGSWQCCHRSGTEGAPLYTRSWRCWLSSSSPVHPLCRVNLSHVNLNWMPHQKLHTSANWSMIVSRQLTQ